MIKVRSLHSRLLVCASLLGLAVSCSDDVTGVRGIPVVGTVYLRDGPPLPGATVFFQPVGGVTAEAYALTDDQGRFATLLREGTHEVWVTAGMATKIGVVTVRPPRVTLDLHYPQYRVTGTVVGPGGVPITAGDVFVFSSTNTNLAYLGPGGLFSLFLPADSFDMFAEPDWSVAAYAGFPRVKRAGIVISSDTTLAFSVDGHAVTGTVSGPGGTPLPGAVVGASSGAALAFAHAGTGGTYRMYLPAGNYVFTVSPPAGADTLVTRQDPPILIDAPRTLDFTLFGPTPTRPAE